jgi:hypothetical protein
MIPLETSNCKSGSDVGFSPTAGAAGVADAGVAAVSEAAVLFVGALALLLLLSDAIAAKGRSNTAKIPAKIRCEVEIIRLTSCISER